MRPGRLQPEAASSIEFAGHFRPGCAAAAVLRVPLECHICFLRRPRRRLRCRAAAAAAAFHAAVCRQFSRRCRRHFAALPLSAAPRRRFLPRHDATTRRHLRYYAVPPAAGYAIPISVTFIS